MGENQAVMAKRDAIFERFAPGFIEAKEALQTVKGHGKRWDEAWAKYSALQEQAWQACQNLSDAEWLALNS